MSDRPVLENFRLTVFRALAEKKNFRRAAEQLYLTQPAVTQQIKALDRSSERLSSTARAVKRR